MSMIHKSVPASFYDEESVTYDQLNQQRSSKVNHTLQQLLQHYQVKTVLDLACGTGSQAFWLAEYGIHVTGVDINEKMLQIAHAKAKEQNKQMQFLLGDMRSSIVGKFDAVIIIFNSMGLITKQDFEITIANAKANLQPGGLFIFDIFNLDFLQHGDNITKFTYDIQTATDSSVVRKIQYSTIDHSGILGTHTIVIEQTEGTQTTTVLPLHTMQVYNSQQVTLLLENHGFEILDQMDTDGSPFHPKLTGSMLTVAQLIP